MQDMVKKGRQVFQMSPEKAARGSRHGTHTQPQKVVRGDQHWSRVFPGRRAIGDRNGSRMKPGAYVANRPRGNRHGLAKLTDELVREARDLHAAGVSYSKLAKMFGVSTMPMFRAVKRITWKHV